ncbi:MAG: DsbA family protein [Rhodospirillales bacterium]
MKHKFAAVVLSAALALFAAPVMAPALADEPDAEDKAVFEQMIREYLLANPDVIVEALEIYQARRQIMVRARQAAMLEALAADIENDPMTPKAGAADGDVTLVEFFDYRCGFCKRAFADVQELVETDGRIRYVLKEFPVLGPESEAAGKFALAVWLTQPNRYTGLRNALMQDRGALTAAKVRALAEENGVDVERAEAAMNGPEVAAALRRTYEQAEALGINGTPSFVLGGEVVSGVRDLETFRALVAAARAGG